MPEFLKRTFCLVIFIIGFTSDIFACTCHDRPFLPTDYFSAQYIFKAKVTRIEKSCVVYFEILKHYKGLLPEDRAYTYAMCSHSCPQLGFEVGDTWMVWGIDHREKEREDLHTTGCHRNMEVDKDARHEVDMIELLSSANGPVKTFTETGILTGEGKMHNRMPEGYWKHYDTEGHLAEEGKYRNGKKVGKWMSYVTPDKYNEAPRHNIGKIKEIERYNRKGILRSRHLYDPEGNPIAQELYDRKGREHGLHFSRWFIQNYKHGKRHGRYVSRHYKTFELKVTGAYHNDKPVGKFEYFDEAGNKIGESFDENLMSQ